MSLIYSMKQFLLALVALMVIPIAFANATEEKHGEEEEYQVTKEIMHHISDAHEWHIMGNHENSVSVPLPIVLIDIGYLFFVKQLKVYLCFSLSFLFLSPSPGPIIRSDSNFTSHS